MLILTRQGYAPSEATSLAEGLSRLQDRPDWVLLDLMLPDGNGLDLLRRVKAQGPPARVCVVSGAGPSMLREARRLGADRVLCKPVDVDELLQCLVAVQ